jgi:hypothetical protein
MDGPAHLYNASLLNQFKSSALLQEFYLRNSGFLPNSLTHYILAWLLKFTPPMISEKILLSFFVVALPLSFRLAVRGISGRRHPVTFLIFLLVFSNLLHDGFYNFCFAFIFFNLQLWLLEKLLAQTRFSPVNCFLFIINSLLLLFCHGFVFAAGFVVSMLLIVLRDAAVIPSKAKSVGQIFLLLVPALSFFVYFFFKVSVPNYDYDIDKFQKWRNLGSFSPAIIFDEKNEVGYSIPVFILLLVLTAVTFSRRVAETDKFKWLPVDLFFFLFIALLYLIFHTTDGMFGGMFIHRLFYFAFYAWILWLSCMRLNAWLSLATLVLVFYSFIHLATERKKVMLAASPEIESVLKAGAMIPGESVVQVIDLSQSWFRGHFSNYMGVNKSIVLTDNYEAVLDWFPLKWKKDINKIDLRIEGATPPDFVFVYTNPRSKVAQKAELTGLPENKVKLIFTGEGGSCSLYQVVKN